MKKTEMLILSPYSYPEQVATSHLTQDLHEAFRAAGFHITIYTPTPCRGIDKETRKKYKRIKHETSADGSIDYYRFSLFREGKNPVGRAFRYLLCNLIQYRKGVRTKGVDLVFAASTPPTQGFLCGKVAAKLSKKYGRKVPFVYNLQDVFPDSLVNAGMTKKGSLLWKIGRKIEDATYRRADRIITISDDFKANLLAKGVPEEKIVVISNWVNTDNVYPVAREDNILFDRYGLDRSLFYICYSGNIGHSQNMDLLLTVAAELAPVLPRLRFVLIGEGAAVDGVKARIEAEHIENVICLPFQDYSEIAHVFSLGDAGLIISKPRVGGSSVPSKTYSIMAAQRPILASFDEDSNLSNLIRKIGCGVVADASSKEQLAAAIKSFYENMDACAAMGKKGRHYVTTELKKEKCTAAYVQTLLTVLNPQA